MNRSRDTGQPQSPTKARTSGWLALSFALAAAAGAGAWFFSLKPAAPHRAAMQPPTSPHPAPSAEPAMPPPIATPEPPAPIAKSAPAPSALSLEQRYRSTRDTAARIDLIGEIAGGNDAAAVLCLARLFASERHPAVKVALLAALGDIDPEAAPEARLAMLIAALESGSRDVRTTALDGLADIEDPRATATLQRAQREDPDKEVRDIAGALLQAATR